MACRCGLPQLLNVVIADAYAVARSSDIIWNTCRCSRRRRLCGRQRREFIDPIRKIGGIRPPRGRGRDTRAGATAWPARPEPPRPPAPTPKKGKKKRNICRNFQKQELQWSHWAARPFQRTYSMVQQLSLDALKKTEFCVNNTHFVSKIHILIPLSILYQ